MKVSCCAYSLREMLKDGRMSLEGFVDFCADNRLDAVELTSYYFPETKRTYLNGLKQHVFRRGLAVSGTAVGGAFTEPDAEKRAQHIAMVKEWIDHSVVLGSPCLRVFAGPVPEGWTEAQAFDWAVKGLRDCVPYAQRKGVVIALENHGGITSTADQILAFAKAIRSRAFGINLDCGNFGQDPYGEMQRTARYAVTTHAKVRTKSPEGRQLVDYARVRQILDKAGYRGYLSIEYEEPEDPLIAVPRFASYLRGVVN